MKVKLDKDWKVIIKSDGEIGSQLERLKSALSKFQPLYNKYQVAVKQEDYETIDDLNMDLYSYSLDMKTAAGALHEFFSGTVSGKY